eukprot:11330451-Alexandrium_andersonii.AAC.1
MAWWMPEVEVPPAGVLTIPLEDFDAGPAPGRSWAQVVDPPAYEQLTCDEGSPGAKFRRVAGVWLPRVTQTMDWLTCVYCCCAWPAAPGSGCVGVE